MEEKYAWAQQSNDIIQAQVHLYRHLKEVPTHLADLAEVKRALWSFLEAYQQIRTHYGVWMKEIKRGGQANQQLDVWKAKFLGPEQAQIWDAVRDFRTLNAHNEVVLPTITVQRQVLGINGKAVMINGRIAGLGSINVLKVRLKNEEYNLPQIISTTLALLRRFIDEFDQIG